MTVLRSFKAGQAHGIWADGRIVTELLGYPTCLYPRVGEPHTLQAVCPPACLCVPHSMSPFPQRDSQCGAPTPLNTRYKQSQQGAHRYYATELHTTHVSPLRALGTVYLTQSQGYEDTAYQAHSQGYGKLLPLVAQISGWGSQTTSNDPTLTKIDNDQSCQGYGKNGYPHTFHWWWQ